VEALSLALLGVSSVRFVHGRFDGLRAKPLCGGRARRNGDGDAGLFDRRMAHAVANGKFVNEVRAIQQP
jgi:hypothetical protein